MNLDEDEEDIEYSEHEKMAYDLLDDFSEEALHKVNNSSIEIWNGVMDVYVNLPSSDPMIYYMLIRMYDRTPNDSFCLGMFEDALEIEDKVKVRELINIYYDRGGREQKIYEMGIKAEIPEAMYYLGCMALRQDMNDGYKLLKQASDLNYDKATKMLSKMEKYKKYHSLDCIDLFIKYDDEKDENVKLRERIDELEAQLKYQPGGIGFLEAKTSYENTLNL